MTLRECIDEINAIEPNAYADEQKALWVMRAEGSVATGVYLMEPEDVSRPELTDNSGDYDFPLLALKPFDKLYPLYLHAMIHYANSEYERYQNDMQLYNEAYGEFARWFAAKFDPALTVEREMKDIRIALAPGEAAEGDFSLPDVRGAVSPFHVVNGGLSGTVAVRCDGWTLLDWDSADGGNAHMAFYAPEGGIVGHYDLANSGGEPAEIHIRTRHYRCGWPDRYGRRS